MKTFKDLCLCKFKLNHKTNTHDINDLNNLLEKYGLFAFQHQTLERMVLFFLNFKF